MQNSKKYKLLKRLYWDYDIDPKKIYRLLTGEITEYSHFTAKNIFLRMLTTLSWYSILDIIALDRVKELLTAELIKKIRSRSLRRRYEVFREVLSGKAISSSGWDSKDSERIKYPLLSDRWYCTKQDIL